MLLDRAGFLPRLQSLDLGADLRRHTPVEVRGPWPCTVESASFMKKWLSAKPRSENLRALVGEVGVDTHEAQPQAQVGIAHLEKRARECV